MMTSLPPQAEGRGQSGGGHPSKKAMISFGFSARHWQQIVGCRARQR